MSRGWAKVHNDLWSSRKWMRASMAARGLWVTALAYSNAMQTYGGIEGHLLPVLGGSADLAAELVEVGLWEVDGDGWRFHDWDDHQTSREHAEAVSAKRAEAGRKGGKARATKTATTSTNKHFAKQNEANGSKPEASASNPAEAPPEGVSNSAGGPSSGSTGNRTDNAVTSMNKQLAKQNEANGSKPKQEKEKEEEQEEQLPPYPPATDGLLLTELPRKRGRAFVYPDAFEALWQAWPKPGDTKRTAHTAWVKATRGTRREPPRITVGELQAAVERYAADPNLPEPQFIPACSTWINQDRWENGPLPPRGRGGFTHGMDTVARLRAQRLGAGSTPPSVADTRPGAQNTPPPLPGPPQPANARQIAAYGFQDRRTA